MNKLKFRISLIGLMFAFFICTIFLSCESAKTTVHGIENVGYLQVAGNTQMYTTVEVSIDDGKSFSVDVNNIKQRSTKYKYTYKISTGSHNVKVSLDGKTLVYQKIFVSANQMKIIELP